MKWWWRYVDCWPNAGATEEVMQANRIAVVEATFAAIKSAALFLATSVLYNVDELASRHFLTTD